MKNIGRVAYGALFVVVLPAALAAWAMRLDRILDLPVIASAFAGSAIATAGALLMAGGVVALKRYGNGWPMSPYPPERRVSRGVYAIAGDPIYAGAVLFTAGMSVLFGSAAGLWIVTPVLALACIAFVAGYEREKTVARFGSARSQPLLRLPERSNDAPAIADRLSIYLLVLLPWLLAFEAVNAFGAPGSHDGWTRIDSAIPLLPWTELPYFLAYPFVIAVPLVARTRSQLRDFAIEGWIATVAVTMFYLTVPVAVVPKPVPSGSVVAPMMLWERSFDASSAALPAFHVVWAALAAAAFSRAIPRLRVVWWTLAAAIALSCLTTGMHAATDVVAGVVAAALILAHRGIVRLLVIASGELANSWREWDFGVVRLMSHGLYAALGAFLGFAIVVKLTGEVAAALFVGVTVIAGAALWAQLIEGSPQLLRPFGYFGGVIGGCAAVLVTPDPWLMLAAYAVAAPVIQACGRCRCLVQGCCHGRPAPDAIGIRYVHPRSRVTRLSAIASHALHPTQLYSIASNAVMFVVLLRLWSISAPLPFIAGTYFILSGLARFVEEHFRGEPQTAVIGGLHSYQWLSIASVVAGALLTCFPNAPAPEPGALDLGATAAAALIAIATYAAYGIDFPRLNTRFARLV